VASGVFPSCSTATWTITSDGVLTFAGTGTVSESYSGDYQTSTTPWFPYQSSITSAVFTGSVSYTSLGFWFDNCRSLKSVSAPAGFGAVGLDPHDELGASRIWVEMKLLTKLRSIMSVAIPRTHDLASSLAKTLRRFGLEPPATSDPALREAVMEFFNTFVRMALVARDPRTVFIVFDQYRLFAVAMNPGYPSLVLEIAFYFTYYGKLARGMGLEFVAEVAAHDLGKLVRQAWEAEAPNRQKLLERFLLFDADARVPLAGVKKAHAILASYFALVGLPEPARLVRESLAGMPRELLATLRDDLLHVHREKYWEVNERRMNLDYVPEEQRETLRLILDTLDGTPGPAKPRG